MKRIKSVWMRLLVIVISVAMILGCFGGQIFAEDLDGEQTDTPQTTPAQNNGAVLHSSNSLKTKVALGDEIIIPVAGSDATVTVKSPTGEDITEDFETDEGKLSATATILGNYTVTYTSEANNVSYSYNINCYQDAEYFIYVKDNGAKIPTYIKTGDTFKLPEWYLATYNDDGEIEKVENADIDWKINEEDGAIDADDNVKIEKSGSHIISLKAFFTDNGAQVGNKTFSKDFTIIAQKDFKDEVAPTLRNISNMPSSASVRTKVTLPKATASDDFDENVYVKVTVKGPSDDNDASKTDFVKQVRVENDFAVEELDEKVDFDNNEVVSFYPWRVGTYVVEYTAYDDADNASSVHSYNITVTDRTGPVILDANDEDIPTAWGLKSVRNAAKTTITEADEAFTIRIPVPEVVDNLDEFILEGEGEEGYSGKIKMNVEIKNPNVTVANFKNLTPEKIAAGGDDVKAYKDTAYSKYYKENRGIEIVTEKGGRPYIKLNFGDFNEDEKGYATGIWTITFSFRDSNNNGGYGNAQKVYTIDVSDAAFVDDKLPEITAPTLPEYLIINEDTETYTVPYITVSDNKDSRLKEEYFLKVGEDELAVKGGEELKVVKVTPDEGDEYFALVNEDEEELKLIDHADLEFVFSAQDDAGNVATLYKDEEAEENYSVKLYIAKGGFDEEDVNINIRPSDEENKLAIAGKSEVTAIGGFEVANIAQREFVGFELSINDENGVSLDGVVAYMSFVEMGEDNYTLYVKNISFKPANGGIYQVNIRILDAIGNSYLYAKNIYVEDLAGLPEGPKGAASAWESVATTRKSYTFERKSYLLEEGQNAEDYINVFKIEGGKFSVLGYEFTPIDQGYYSITEFYGEKNSLTDSGDYIVEGIEGKLTWHNNYSMTASDVDSLTFEIVGSLPSYHKGFDKQPANEDVWEDDAFYPTNPIIAYSETQNYEVSVSYVTPKSETKTANKIYEYTGTPDEDHPQYTFDDEEEGYEFRGRFALIFAWDGTYNVTVSVNGKGSESYTIKVGDIEPPQFTVNTDVIYKTVGDSFKFDRKIEYTLDEDNGETVDDVEVYYELYDPSNTVVTSVSSHKSLKDYDSDFDKNGAISTSEYTFEKSGEYRVRITLEDEAGNRYSQNYRIIVSTATSNTPASLTMLSTVLIIVGVLLILGVIVYLIRFRKRKA